MKTSSVPPRCSFARFTPLGLLFLAATSVHAQLAPAPRVGPDAATLARYDTNRNGRLDPDELAAMEFMLDKMKSTKSNDEFFTSMKR